MSLHIRSIGFFVIFLVANQMVSCSEKNLGKGQGDDEAKGKGIIDGNGGGGPNYKSNPWFLGPAPVTYCIRKSDNFSVPFDELKIISKDVIVDWTSTVPSIIEEQTAQLLVAKGISYSTEFVEEDCRDDIDLIFSFGHLDDDMRRAVAYQPHNVLGLAARRHYDLSTLRGKGTIYIAPDLGNERYRANKVNAGFWKDTDSLHNVLMHEFGHVMGFTHDDSSFMHEYYPEGRITVGVKNRVTAQSFKTRKQLGTDRYSLCGKPWFSDQPGTLTSKLYRSKSVCLKAGFNRNIDLWIEVAGGSELATYEIDGSNAGGDFNSVNIRTINKSYELFSYAETFEAVGHIKENGHRIPFVFKLEADWYSIKIAESQEDQWSEAAFLSTDLSVYNRASN